MLDGELKRKLDDISAHIANLAPRGNPMKKMVCSECKRNEHTVDNCWVKHPELRPAPGQSGNSNRSRGKNARPKHDHLKAFRFCNKTGHLLANCPDYRDINPEGALAEIANDDSDDGIIRLMAYCDTSDSDQEEETKPLAIVAPRHTRPRTHRSPRRNRRRIKVYTPDRPVTPENDMNFLDEDEWAIHNAANRDLEDACSDRATTRLRLDTIIFPQSLHCNTMPCSNHADNSEEDDSTLSGDSETTAVDRCIAATAEDIILYGHVDADYIIENGLSHTGDYNSFGIDEEDDSKLICDIDTTTQTDASQLRLKLSTCPSTMRSGHTHTTS
jgi:hypothetical protein